MKRAWRSVLVTMCLAVLAVLCLASLACGGGGGSGGGGDCADLASAVNACSEQAGGDEDPTIQGQCQAYTCTGDKQAAIECVRALECSEDIGDDVEACLARQGCALPVSCQGLAYETWNCGGDAAEMEETLSLCNGVTCTGSKPDAIACVMALGCDAEDEERTACLLAQGCSLP